MTTISVYGKDYNLSEAQVRALLIIEERRRERKGTSAGDEVKANTLTSLVAMGLLEQKGNPYAPFYVQSARGLSVARALRKAQA